MHVISRDADIAFNFGKRLGGSRGFFIGSLVAFESAKFSEDIGRQVLCAYSVVISPIRYFSTNPPGAESTPAGTFNED